MNTKFNLLYQDFASAQAEGFSTSFALGLGLITIVASTIAIAGSQQEQNNSTMRDKISHSLSAAQIGTAYYRDLINQNRIIATHNACLNWNDDSCQDGVTDISWAKASNIPGINPACPNRGAGAVAAKTDRSWKDVSAANASSGQYRLLDYTFDSTTNMGKLVVEGRANSRAEAAITRLEVQLPIQPGIVDTEVSLAPRFNSLDPAVWIGGSAVTATGNLTVDGNLLLSDANCTLPSGTGQPTVANLRHQDIQSIIADPRSLPSTPTTPATVNTVTNTDVIDAAQLPRAGDSGDGDNFYHYVVTDGLNLSGNTLKISEGTKVILYVQGDITLDGNVEINQGTSNSSAYLEIYGTGTTTSINFTGSGQQNIKAFIHAPNATVNLNSSDLTVSLVGAVWIGDWNGVSGVMNMTPDDQYINYSTVKSLIAQGNSRVVDPLILAPRIWNTKEIN